MYPHGLQRHQPLLSSGMAGSKTRPRQCIQCLLCTGSHHFSRVEQQSMVNEFLNVSTEEICALKRSEESDVHNDLVEWTGAELKEPNSSMVREGGLPPFSTSSINTIKIRRPFYCSSPNEKTALLLKALSRYKMPVLGQVEPP
ncbi:hypothetical protein TNCV_124281 [Trichonephila clavipes]|nr:hypothetical protein TNCV_124281 [Trichonephila clavipes]